MSLARPALKFVNFALSLPPRRESLTGLIRLGILSLILPEFWWVDIISLSPCRVREPDGAVSPGNFLSLILPEFWRVDINSLSPCRARGPDGAVSPGNF